jgi:hypothetical protein
MSYDWILIAKREHLLAPQVAEVKIKVCGSLRESAANNNQLVLLILGTLGNLAHYRHLVHNFALHHAP